MKPGSHISWSWECRRVKEWTPTLPNELPLWELEFRWIPEFSEGDWRGQKSLDWRVPYIIGKFLKHKCLKWAHMTHLDTWSTSYGQMKSWEWNCQFDSRPLKVWNLLDLFVWRWCATYRWKTLKKDYNFVSHLISIGGLTKSYGPPKLLESQFGEKWHLGASLVARHK